jgi:hypothetical protein
VASRSRLPVAASLLVVLAGVALAPASAGPEAQSATIVVPPTYSIAPWGADSSNLVPATGTVELGGVPVSGVGVRVDGYQIPAATNAKGQFTYLLDHTLLSRHIVAVVDDSGGKADGKPLSPADQTRLAAAQGSIQVAYPVTGLEESTDAAGDPVVSGRVATAAGAAPPKVGLLTYQLKGTVTDSNGRPVAGAVVSTRTTDRDYWTISTVTGKDGRYSSLFTASSESQQDPVPFTIRVSIGDTVYQFLQLEFVYFKRLESATLDIRLPPRGYPMAIPEPVSYPGALYTGILVGAAVNGAPVKPVSATWPSGSGRFQLTLPKSLAGKTVTLWEAKLQLFSRTPATAGGPVDVAGWPRTLPPDAPRNLASVTLSR